MRPERCSVARNTVPVTGMQPTCTTYAALETEPDRKPHDRKGVPVGRAEEPWWRDCTDCFCNDGHRKMLTLRISIALEAPATQLCVPSCLFDPMIHGLSRARLGVVLRLPV